MNEQGFLKVSRGYFKGFFWKEKRTFSKAEAWLDLLSSARYETTIELINGRMTEVRKGEVPISRRYLEERWKWGGTKVLNFLEMLSSQGLKNQRQDRKQTILFICECGNYEDEQTSDKPVTNQLQTNDKPVTNQPCDKSRDNVTEKTNQLISQKQTMSINCNIDDCNERQANRKPQNKPVTNQSQTSDKPVANEKLSEERPETNQIKEIRIKNKENINNIPLNPPEEKDDEKLKVESGKSKKPKKEVAELKFPFSSEKFINAWGQLVNTPKWKKKIPYTLQLALNQLSKYEEEFAIKLIDAAAANDWQGVVFPQTDDQYSKWKSGKNSGKSNFANHDNTKHYEQF